MIALMILAAVALVMVLSDWRRARAFRRVHRTSKGPAGLNIIEASAPSSGGWKRFLALHPQVRELIYLPIPLGCAALAALALI